MVPRIENGLVIGNTYDKYGSKNPVAKKLMSGFLDSVASLVDISKVNTVHEVGCGEGHLSNFIHSRNIQVKGTDVSKEVLADAKMAYPDIFFEQKSIYELDKEIDSAELIVCCEVLEHLENPSKALNVLQSLASPYLIASVPREPLWRVLNMLRGKYWGSLGNTPGHLNHWSKRSFLSMLENHFEVIKTLTPLPWTIALCKTRRSIP